MGIEELSYENLAAFTRLVLELWPECSCEAEYENGKYLIQSDKNAAFLFRNKKVDFIAFATFSLRTDYVEGTHSSPVGYLEGIYVRPAFRKQGVAAKLLKAGEAWCRKNGCLEMASDAELDNEISQAFHRNAGFEEVNRIVCFKKRL